MTKGPRRNDVSSPAAELAPLVPISEPDPIRVLLIEDNDFYRETLTYALLEQGFAVQSFGDGVSPLGALDTGRARRPCSSATRQGRSTRPPS
jgi:hypothetical protein